MASLTKVSILTRRSIRLGIYGIIGIIILRALILNAIRVYRHYFPPPPPPPTVSFGRLPALPFPKKDGIEGLSFTLETPEGVLPTLPSQAKVYFMPKLSPHLLSLDAAKEKAKALGFSPEGVEVTETVYKFPNPKVPAELQISIVSGVFSISYNLGEDPTPLETIPPASEIAAAKVRSFLSSGGVLPEDLTGPTIPEFVKLEEGKIVGAISLSESDFIKINFFRKNFDNLPSLTPSPEKGNVWFIVSGSYEKEKLIISGQFHHFPVEESQNATYPIKTSQAAWEELTAGKAYLASIGEPEVKNRVIRRVYLAYYDPGVPADFYQPIIVFEGDKNFVAYVPAVTSDYYGE